MESLSIKRYFDWNDALRRFFLRDSDAAVKLLCVDDEILGIIGEKYGIEKHENISFPDHFKRSVALSNEGRSEMIAFWQNDMRCPVNRGGSSLFQFAWRLSKIEVPTWVPERYELPSLALTALFILLCTDDRAPIDSIKNSLSILTGNPRESESGGVDHIPDLFSAIVDYDPAFDNNRRGARTNVGPIQYQKVLKQREITLFKKFLFCNHVILDESLSSYEDLMNYSILGKMHGEFEPLRQRVVHNNQFVHEEYFIRQIQSFDKERYIKELNEGLVSTPKILGTLYLVVGFTSAQGISFDVYIDVAVDILVRTTRGDIPVPLEESYNGLYPTNISINSLDSYCDLSCKDDQYEINLGQNNGGPFYFRESGGHLVQTHAPEIAHSYYVVIKHLNRRAINELRDHQSAEDVDLSSVFGAGWDSFYVSDWREYRRNYVVKSEESIKSGPGIPVPGERDMFFDKGLPSIVVPGDHNCNIMVELDIVGNGQRALPCVRKKQNGCIYLDLTLPHNHPHQADGLPIIVKNGRDAIDAYRVLSPQIEQDFISSYDHLFIYDGWGRICVNREVPRLNDNILIGSSINTFGTKNSEPLHKLQTWEECSMRFIELLRASFLKSGFLLRKDINEIVSYLAGYYDLPRVENKGKEYECLIKALVDLGFLNESYNDTGSRIYQLASPRLFPMAMDVRGIPRFVLYGSYIKTQITLICNITPYYCFVKPYSEDEVKEHPYLAFIPLFMIASLNKDQIEYVKTLRITVEENTLSDIILSLVKTPQEFPADFMTDDNRLTNDSFDDKVSYPRVVSPFGRWRLEDQYNIYESYRPDNQTYRRVPIPNALMRQYCRSLSSDPVFFFDEGRKVVAFINEMPIPSLIKKCLTYINLGLPNNKLIFGLDGALGENIINKVFEYSVRGEDQSIIAQKIAGSSTPKVLRYKLFGGKRFLMYYIKSSRSTRIYEPFQVHLYFAFSPTKPYAFANKTGNSYSVFLRVGDNYYQLRYPSAVLAFSAIIREHPDLANHVDRSNESKDGPLMEKDAIKKAITIIE